jgi:hypothetical protein
MKKAPRGIKPKDALNTWKLCLSSGRAWILYGLSISQSKGSRKGLSYYWQADGADDTQIRLCYTPSVETSVERPVITTGKGGVLK